MIQTYLNSIYNNNFWDKFDAFQETECYYHENVFVLSVFSISLSTYKEKFTGIKFVISVTK